MIPCWRWRKESQGDCWARVWSAVAPADQRRRPGARRYVYFILYTFGILSAPHFRAPMAHLLPSIAPYSPLPSMGGGRGRFCGEMGGKREDGRLKYSETRSVGVWDGGFGPGGPDGARGRVRPGGG